jgi:hypothetical protein
MSIQAHERVAELELALKKAAWASGMSAAAVEYCLAFLDYRREAASVSGTNLGTEVWAAYNRRLRDIQARMDKAWADFEREAARHAPPSPSQSHQDLNSFRNPNGVGLSSCQKTGRACRTFRVD